MIKKFTYKLFLTLATSLLLLTSLCLTSPLTTRNHLHKQLVVQPTLYFHGWAGSANSTNHLIAAAAALPQVKKVLTITVTESGQLAISGSWQDNVKYPLIQVLFANNQAEIPQQARWIDRVVTYLQTNYHIQSFNIVTHSMAGPATFYWAITSYRPTYPQFNKFVAIAGPFDGVIHIDDVPNQNYFRTDGLPAYQNAAFKNYYRQRQAFPKNTQVLNIYGNLADGSNSDSLVTNVSARSLGSLVKGQVASYQEITITGPSAQHSRLHNNDQVNHVVDNFLFK